MIAGVLSGLADYFGWDVTLVRLGFVGIMLITRIVPLTILYILAAFIIPEKPKAISAPKTSEPDAVQSDHQTAQ